MFNSKFITWDIGTNSFSWLRNKLDQVSTYPFLINAVRDNQLSTVSTSLENLQDGILSHQEEFQLLIEVIIKYRQRIDDIVNNGVSPKRVDDLSFLNLIRLIINKFSLVLDKEETSKLWDKVRGLRSFRHKALMQILLTTKDTISNFHIYFQDNFGKLQQNLDDFFCGKLPEGLSDFNGGFLVEVREHYYRVISAHETVGSISMYYHLEERCSAYLLFKIRGEYIKNSTLEIMISQIIKGLGVWTDTFDKLIRYTNVEALDYFMDRGEMKCSSMMYVMKPLFMLCDFHQRDEKILLEALPKFECKKIASLCDAILKDNSNTESNKFINLIMNIFAEQSLDQSLCKSIIFYMCEITEKILKKIEEKDDSIFYPGINSRSKLLCEYLYHLFEIYSYSLILAEKLDLKINNKNLRMFKERILMCLEDKEVGPYFTFLIEHTNDTVEKELEKIKLAKNQYTNFSDVVIFTKYEKFEEAIEQDHLTTRQP